MELVPLGILGEFVVMTVVLDENNVMKLFAFWGQKILITKLQEYLLRRLILIISTMVIYQS